ncbi:hypothetical protein ERJ75_000616100 [Trypanosoma vivax]|nr:hypothetical protein ERJ75_000616100 [Trypanosoma vivax]
MRSDAKAVSTRVAEGNLALTTEEREEARGPRDLAKLGQGAASELLDQRANATSVARRRQSKHARLLSRRAARRKRGRQAARGHIRQGRGGSSGGELLGGGGEEKRRGACGGVSEPARDRDRSEGTRGTGPGSSGEDAERNAGGKKQLV